jgi:hypothetical protein
MFALLRATAAIKFYPRAFKLTSFSNEWAAMMSIQAFMG